MKPKRFAAQPAGEVPHYFADWLDFELKMFRTASPARRLSCAAAWQI
jgi:hypothetical protein